MTLDQLKCAATLTAALDMLANIDRSQLTEGQQRLLETCEAGLTLLEQDFHERGRDPELAEYARCTFGIH